jgi:hypothetical protein
MFWTIFKFRFSYKLLIICNYAIIYWTLRIRVIWDDCR